MNKYLYLLPLLFFPILLPGQSAMTASFTPEAWEVMGETHEFATHHGKEALYLKNGLAILKDSHLENGIIEYDILFEEEREFLGVHFRDQGNGTYEEFYVRPHQSGNPDAMQYTPVINQVAGWQLYHGQGYSAAYRYLFGEWNHIRLVIDDDRMEVFINDMSVPVLYAHNLKLPPRSGTVGFGASLGGAYFANLKIHPWEHPVLLSARQPLPETPAGTITQWLLSDAFDAQRLAGITTLTGSEWQQHSWTPVKTEYSGLVNLATAARPVEGSNAVLVKVTIESDRDQIQRLEFGYSDAAKVFINGRALYEGSRIFTSRDYRYLGTIGYFDSVYLPLKSGRNELIIAVFENFGGWGLKARLVEGEGLNIVE